MSASVTPRIAPKAQDNTGHFDWFAIAWFSGLVLAAYAVVLARTAGQWVTDPDMGHGLFVPLLVGYVVWQERDRIRAVKLSPNRIGLLLMVIGGALLCVGPPSVETYVSVARLAFAFSLVGAILNLCGFAMLRVLAYPLLLLLMMFPLPGFVLDRVTLPLQFLASSLAEASLDSLGYSVLREGNILRLPGLTLSVAEACSGLRSLLALTFIAQAYVYLFDKRPWVRLPIAVAVLPIAVFANSIRIVLSAIAGSYHREWAAGYFHESTGLVMFAVAFLGIILAHLLARKVHKAIRLRG